MRPPCPPLVWALAVDSVASALSRAHRTRRLRDFLGGFGLMLGLLVLTWLF